MKIEHLVATTNMEDFKLYSDLNLKTSAIIANQNGKNEFKKKINNNSIIKIISTDTKGVGKNRNLALMFADSDICILSDDDMKYEDNYLNIVQEAFKLLPEADVIIFNIKTIGDSNELIHRRINKKIKKINSLNFMNYGAARIAFKLKAIRNKNIWFSTMFGGGSKYSSGEDTLFLADCLRKKMKIYAYPKFIATVKQETSTWIRGYNEKFFYDKGALLSQIRPKTKYLFTLFYFPFRFKCKLSYLKKVRLMCAGIREYNL